MSKKIPDFKIFLLLSIFFISLNSTVSADGRTDAYVESGEMIVFEKEGTFQLVEALDFSIANEAKGKGMEISIPQRAENVVVMDGVSPESVQLNQGKMVLDLPKGNTRLIFAFQLPAEDLSASYLYQQSFWTKEMRVTIQSEKVSVMASRFLTQSESLDLNGQPFRRFTRLDIHENEPWDLMFRQTSFSDTHVGDEQDFTEDGLKILGHEHGANPAIAFANLGLIVSILTLGILSIRMTMGWRERKKKQQLPARKEILLQELVSLHRKREKGIIGEEQYADDYQRIQQQLLQLARETDGRGA
ncbi:hypothetical protein L1765_00875 [Microaerobacter geothermalis]|uniref:hypothetical protein n=1 Tax=Microaerobacter geothermalis TaxID=674972 RepID=UPI001F1DC3B5|nr:hypothetical protein [Microaerobacter geothermalis]MCF6092545.1 hypothetical protein [Microaerobacter geothermalis]